MPVRRGVTSVEGLVAQAVETTGLSEMGPYAWRDGLEVLVAAARREADLNGFGVDLFESWVGERLRNRLGVIDWINRHPAVADAPVVAPLVVVGMLRTGSTILLELLATDPAQRALMKWEALDSVPPPQTATFTSDARIARWVEVMDTTYAMVPSLKAIHWEPGDGPTECVALLGQAFRSQDWLGLFHLPSYVDWYLSADLTPAYAFHRQALQVLQSEAPGGWVLKAPGHLLGLDALVATYPDARIVVLHRDPLRTVPSSVSLSTTAFPNSLTNDLDTTSWWGPLWMRMLGEMVDHLGDFRQRRGDVAIMDLHYTDLAADPIAAVRSIHRHFGGDLSVEAEAAAQQYLADHPRGGHGHHQYSLDDAGISVASVEQRFANYCRDNAVVAEGIA